MGMTSTERTRQWRPDNPERHKTYMRDRMRRKRWAALGLDQEGYDDLMLACAGACSVCRVPFGDDVPACVDHNHETGAVRGLLCHRCNLALGYLRDSADYAQAAADYLRQYTVQDTEKG